MDKKELREKLIAFKDWLIRSKYTPGAWVHDIRENVIDEYMSTLPSGEQQQGHLVVYIIQHKETRLLHGCFIDKKKAEQFAGNGDVAVVPTIVNEIRFSDKANK